MQTLGPNLLARYAMFSKTVAVAALALAVSAQDSTLDLSDALTSLTATATLLPSTTGTGGLSDVSAQTTISAFVGEGVYGSVVSADACQTVLAVQCDDENNYYCSVAAQYGLDEMTYTQRPTAYNFDLTTSLFGINLVASASCDLQGTSPSWTAEVCTASVSARGSGTSTSDSTTTTFNTAPTLAALSITGGASNLPTGSATCSTNNDGAAAPTASAVVYKVLVPVAAAVVGAGALL